MSPFPAWTDLPKENEYSIVSEDKGKRVYFFAASHVILRTVKAIPEYGKRKSKHSIEGGDGEKVRLSFQSTSDENENKVLTIIF